MNKNYIYWAIGLVIIIGIFWFAQNAETPTNDFTKQIKGNATSTIQLIEYSDFQCPACAAYYPIVKQLEQEFGDKVGFVYKHFPLRQIHRHAELAAIVAEAAGKQNKFWEMHDLIFENQEEWSKQKDPAENFVAYAKAIGLNLDQFAIDLKSKEIKNKINNDYKNGLKLKVNSTPSFFLNEKKIKNPQTYKEFKSLLENALNG